MIELLVAVTIAAFVSGIVYSLFITGLNLYQKIQIEGQLREDADYIATMIMNELTANQPRFVTPFHDGDKYGVTLNVAHEKQVEDFVIIDSKEEDDEKVDIFFEGDNFIIDHRDGDKTTLSLSDSTFITDKNSTSQAKVTGLSLDADGDCIVNSSQTSCTHSTIHLTMVIENDNKMKGFFVHTEPIILESSFGF